MRAGVTRGGAAMGPVVRGGIGVLSGIPSRSGRAGMVTVLFRVVRTESLLGLWKGVSPVSGSSDLDLIITCTSKPAVY